MFGFKDLYRQAFPHACKTALHTFLDLVYLSMDARNYVNKWTCTELRNFGIAWNHCNNEKTSYEIPRWASNPLSLVVCVREKFGLNASWLDCRPFPRRGGRSPQSPTDNVWPVREHTVPVTRWSLQSSCSILDPLKLLDIVDWKSDIGVWTVFRSVSHHEKLRCAWL